MPSYKIKIFQNRYFSLFWRLETRLTATPVTKFLDICTCIVILSLDCSGHMQKVGIASLWCGAGQCGCSIALPEQYPLCTARNIINPRGSCQWCVAHNFLWSICWGKPLAMLIDKLRPAGAVGGIFLWTVLNWYLVFLFSLFGQCSWWSTLHRSGPHWGIP